MAKISGVQKIGIVVLILSFLIGIIGTVWSIYSSFGALDAAEFGGIGPVSDQIKNALWFSAGGFVGCVAGALLIVLGRAKPRDDQHTRSDL